MESPGDAVTATETRRKAGFDSQPQGQKCRTCYRPAVSDPYLIVQDAMPMDSTYFVGLLVTEPNLLRTPDGGVER